MCLREISACACTWHAHTGSETLTDTPYVRSHRYSGGLSVRYAQIQILGAVRVAAGVAVAPHWDFERPKKSSANGFK